jgi:spore maturation protein CgeB
VTSPWAGRKVLLVDALDHDPTGHAALRRRALERLGCTVHGLDLRPRQGLLQRWRQGTVASRLAQALLQHQPDLVLVVDAALVPAGLLLEQKREVNAAWAAWFIGEGCTLEDVESVGAAYDALFVPGSDILERVRGPSMPPVLHLAPGCDPSVHRPVQARDQFRANVVFAGTATPYREQCLTGLVEFGLAVWGPGWRRTGLRDYCRGEETRQDDFVRAYAGATAAVNVHREDNGGTRTGCNHRLFEVAAIGVPQVVDARADLGLHFLPEHEILTFTSPAELRACVQAVLDQPSGAERLAHAARQRVLAEHTYMHRMTTILSRAFSPPPPAIPG